MTIERSTTTPGRESALVASSTRAASEPVHVEPVPSRRWLGAPFVSMFMLAVAVLCTGLGQGDLRLDAALYGWFAKHIAVTGDWLNLYLDWGQTHYFKKPPLFFWLTAGLFKVFGIHDWAVQFVSVGFAVACVVMLYLLARLRMSAGKAATAGIVLTLTYTFIHNTVSPRLDSALTFCFLLGLYGAARLLDWRGRRLTNWVLIGIACGLGLMVKGGVMLSLVPILVAAFAWAGRRDLLFDWRALIAAVVTLAIAAPWYVQQYLTWGDAFLNGFLWKQNLARFGTERFGDSPWYFYLRELAMFYWPWLGFAAVGAWMLLRPLISSQRQRDDRQPLDSVVKLWIVWGVLYFLMIHLVMRKFDRYLLPMLPVLALLAAHGLYSGPLGLGWRKHLLPHLGWLAVVGFIIVQVGAVPTHRVNMPGLHAVAPIIRQAVAYPGQPRVYLYHETNLTYQCNVQYYTNAGCVLADDAELGRIPPGDFVMVPRELDQAATQFMGPHVRLYAGRRFIYYRVLSGR